MWFLVVFFIYVVIIYENLIFFKKIWIRLIKKKGFLKEGDYLYGIVINLIFGVKIFYFRFCVYNDIFYILGLERMIC